MLLGRKCPLTPWPWLQTLGYLSAPQLKEDKSCFGQPGFTGIHLAGNQVALANETAQQQRLPRTNTPMSTEASM